MSLLTDKDLHNNYLFYLEAVSFGIKDWEFVLRLAKGERNEDITDINIERLEARSIIEKKKDKWHTKLSPRLIERLILAHNGEDEETVSMLSWLAEYAAFKYFNSDDDEKNNRIKYITCSFILPDKFKANLLNLINNKIVINEKICDFQFQLLDWEEYFFSCLFVNVGDTKIVNEALYENSSLLMRHPFLPFEISQLLSNMKEDIDDWNHDDIERIIHMYKEEL